METDFVRPSGHSAEPPSPGSSSTDVGAGERPSTHRGTIEYLGGLDGLRAIAVSGVIAFHFGISQISGGFLGVDVFFVLSGFLITSLLVSEWEQSGAIVLRSFWGRRARRLFPALGLTIIGVSIAAALLDNPSQLAQIRSDAIATVLYIANWHFISSSQHYFTHFGPVSPLLHTWSLAVEEQFYVIWPLVTIAVLKLARRRAGSRLRHRVNQAGTPSEITNVGLSANQRAALAPRSPLVLVALLGAISSAVFMAVTFHPGMDPSRVYYGTDSHAQVILIGALLALLLPWLKRYIAPNARIVMTVFATAGVVVVISMFHWATGNSAWLYRGGFALLSIAVAVIIAYIASFESSLLARGLSIAPLRYIGRISYGLYLYHWPVFVFMTAQATGLKSWQLLAARLSVTSAVSILSFHFLEQPIRKGLSGRLSIRMQWAVLLPAATTAVLATVLISTYLPANSSSHAIVVPSTLPKGSNPGVVLLVGDSVALTLGIGLSNQQAKYGIQLQDKGQLGCSIAEGNPIMVGGSIDTLPLCDSQSNQDWQSYWSSQISQYHPDVVAIQLGRWEVVDRTRAGQWTHIGDPEYNAYLESQLDQAVDLVSASGAQVAIFTSPFFDDGETASGTSFDENNPSRVNDWNAIVKSVARKHPANVTVIDVGSMLDPSGHYAPVVDGVPVRCPDGVHVSWQGGELLAPQIFPELHRLAQVAFQHAPAGSKISPVAAFTEPTVPKSPSQLKSLVSDKSESPICPF